MLGKVRLVISFDNPQLEGNFVILLSNRLDWSAELIVQTYLLRWPIETFYQDSKGQLGWMNIVTNRRSLSKTLVSGLLWLILFYTCIALNCHTKKGLVLPLKTIGEVCRHPVKHWFRLSSLWFMSFLIQVNLSDEVFRLLFAKQGVST
ncbi:MAG: hypothetical protein IPL28_16225 [Chloroflexi bacterium]|nr:hypothetical protein [Chloroflexota bacterium]